MEPKPQHAEKVKALEFDVRSAASNWKAQKCGAFPSSHVAELSLQTEGTTEVLEVFYPEPWP